MKKTVTPSNIDLFTPAEEKAITSNLLAAFKDPDKLNERGYRFLNNASGFIAHGNRFGFIEARRATLAQDILNRKKQNQWDNFSEKDADYKYMMQRKRMYNTVCNAIEAAGYVSQTKPGQYWFGG